MDYDVPLKALVLRDGKNALEDLGDVLVVARSQAKRILRTHNGVRVVDLIRVSYGWIAIFEVPKKVEADARGRTGWTNSK